MVNQQQRAAYTWEQAIEILRSDPKHKTLIFDAYLTADLTDNCRRFSVSAEFSASLDLLRLHAQGFETILDMPAGNGIATVAFAKSGFRVTAVEPDQSLTVGRGAIEFNLGHEGLNANVVDAFGEDLPFPDANFDVVYVRQGLHHARDLPRMTAEIFRVLKPGGVLLAVREHVVDNYDRSLRQFLNSQVDHQLYGGENAFTLADYRSAFFAAGLKSIIELRPYDSPINMYPNDPTKLRDKILHSRPGLLLSAVMPAEFVAKIGLLHLKTRKSPGRLYSFLLKRPY
jgi:SAM-dependent methyltransferase